jgi:maltose phosphorylase
MTQTNWLDEWTLIEVGFNRQQNRDTEQQMWLGNSRFGHRANFEERFSGYTTQKNIVEGAFINTQRKNSNPIPLNCPNWFGIDIEIDGEVLDLNLCAIKEFKRVLHLKKGVLERICKIRMKNGKIINIHAQRFCSIVDDETAAIRYAITPVNFSGKISFMPYIDADVMEPDIKSPEKYWTELEKDLEKDIAHLVAETKNNQKCVATAIRFTLYQDSEEIDFECETILREKYIGAKITLDCEQLQETVLYKFASVISSQNHSKNTLSNTCKRIVTRAYKKGFAKMLKTHCAAYNQRWSDVNDGWNALKEYDSVNKLAFFKYLQSERV